MTRLSYSAWSTHNTCPAKYKFSYLEKHPRGSPSVAMVRGQDIHNGVDSFLKKESEEVPLVIKHHYGQWLSGLREAYVLRPEMRWAVDAEWDRVEWDHPMAKWRGILDLAVDPGESDPAPAIFEWKTGKIYDEHAYQAELYGIIGLIQYPDAESIDVTNVYLDQKKNIPRTYQREDLKGLQAMWDRRHKDVTRDEIHPPNPGFYCRWCDFAKDNGGPCQF